MENYADSSFLVSLFGEDNNSVVAKRHVARYALILPFNPLHGLEVRNFLRLAVKRGEFDAVDRHVAFMEIKADLGEGLLLHQTINWTEALRRAEILSQRHTETLGTRAVDILHVAIALESGAERFLSFDAVQRQLAGAEGLDVQP